MENGRPRLDLRDDALGPPPDADGGAGATDSIGRFDAEVRNALAALVGATSLLHSRWDDLPEERRLLLAESAARRAQELQSALLPVLGRLKTVSARH